MSDDKKTFHNKEQVDTNSKPVERIEIEGSVNGNVVVGNNNQVIIQSFEVSEEPHQEYEPEMIEISEGPFLMTTNVWRKPETPELLKSEVFVNSYLIGRSPITNLQYDEFVRQTNRKVSPSLGWDGRKIPDGKEDFPVMGVTWYDTIDYCLWLQSKTERHYILPDLAQLEKMYQDQYEGEEALDSLLHQWTRTLWGEKVDAPDLKYFKFPWADDRRNDLGANSQIRRVVCVFEKVNGAETYHLRKRIGELPDQAGLPGARYGFRVVLRS